MTKNLPRLRCGLIWKRHEWRDWSGHDKLPSEMAAEGSTDGTDVSLQASGGSNC
ncbi:MAG: hypothetical protein LZF62_60045 [Nitrospira sp.]|nr:MAG: hypothetical protein LZF62_60045 [Nitrospira sp.]